MSPRSAATSSSSRWPGWPRIAAFTVGLAALAWFLIRVVPKPSRAAYPCQRAAFPIASSFVLWLVGICAGSALLSWARRRPGLLIPGVGVVALGLSLGLIGQAPEAEAEDRPASPGTGLTAQEKARLSHYAWTPESTATPVGVARGIHPGRVAWVHDPGAAHWDGTLKNPWWSDGATDQSRVDRLVGTAVTTLTGIDDEGKAWEALFTSFNQRTRGESRGHRPGEVVAVKINLNSASNAVKNSAILDSTPQMVLAIVRQLVEKAGVPPQDVLIYEVAPRRFVPTQILQKVWAAHPRVRFLQNRPAAPLQAKLGPLETVEWVEAITYSLARNYREATQIARQVDAATYLINVPILKAHSYALQDLERGDQGMTGITMAGKNHFGSIAQPGALHGEINPEKSAKPHHYSPLVDLAASPRLGAKTILFLMEGLYATRRHDGHPIHLPHPPFNNRVEPYENPDWPSCVLASQDGVALDSVGLDILASQAKDNLDARGAPRLTIREQACDYLQEMATPDAAPSGVPYRVAGRPVTSLGVHEHWNNDRDRQYSRNLDPVRGQGIELVYKKLP